MPPDDDDDDDDDLYEHLENGGPIFCHIITATAVKNAAWSSFVNNVRF